MELAARMLIEMLREGHRVRYVARGGSMWPTVRDGATVEVTPCAATDLRVGELAAYEGSNGLVLHRVVARGADALSFRGDAQREDDLVPDARVLGRARVVAQPPWRLGLPTSGFVRGAVLAARSWLRRVASRT